MWCGEGRRALRLTAAAPGVCETYCLLDTGPFSSPTAVTPGIELISASPNESTGTGTPPFIFRFFGARLSDGRPSSSSSSSDSGPNMPPSSLMYDFAKRRESAEGGAGGAKPRDSYDCFILLYCSARRSSSFAILQARWSRPMMRA